MIDHSVGYADDVAFIAFYPAPRTSGVDGGRKGAIRIFVRLIGGTTISMVVNLSDTVETIKEKVLSASGIPPATQR